MEILGLLFGGCLGLSVAVALFVLWRSGRISKRAFGGGLTCLVLLALIPAYFLGHYMFLDEPLIFAAERGDLPRMKSLLAMGANIDTPSELDTPLIGAVSNGKHEAAKLLLDRGANPALANDAGESPMHFARTNKDQKMVALLEQFGGH